MPSTRLPLTVAFLVLLSLLLSGIAPYDRLTWMMETLPVMIALPLLIKTYRQFRLTDMLYVLIGLHALVLIVGGAYTYARVPVGFDVQNLFGLDRNPYDKLGHLIFLIWNLYNEQKAQIFPYCLYGNYHTPPQYWLY